MLAPSNSRLDFRKSSPNSRYLVLVNCHECLIFAVWLCPQKLQIMFLVWLWWIMLLASRFGYCSTVMFNSPLKLNLVLKILKLIFRSWCWYEDACSPQDLVNARAQSSDFRKSPPLQHFTPLPCGQFCKCQISKLIAGKREREEHLTYMMPPASDVMTKPCPVRDAATYPSSKSLPWPAVYFLANCLNHNISRSI